MARSRILRLENLQQFAAINVLSDPGHIGGPIVIPNCVQVLLTWSVAGGKLAHNVLYGRAAGVPAPSIAQAQAIFSGLTTGAQWTAFAGHLSSVVSLNSITLTSVHQAGLPSFVSTGANVPGTGGAVALPSEVAIAVTLRTGSRGVANRGRMYITGYDTAQVIAGNIILATCVTDTSAWANTILTQLANQSYTWVIGQPARAAYVGSSGTQHPARLAGSVPITSILVRDNHWDSQRRRGLK